jgi:site-specific recombinase XerD
MTLGLSQVIQLFFTECLPGQRNASHRTLQSYRDCVRLFLIYMQEKARISPERLGFTDLTADHVLEFLAHLEKDRRNSIRTRNLRLAAIRTLMRFVAFKCPEALHTANCILAIPFKRTDQPILGFLSQKEMKAVLDAPSASAWSGRRDRVMLQTLYNTGGRVSEIATLRVQAVHFSGRPAIDLYGKGRKERTVPIWKETAEQLNAWITENAFQQADALFPNRHGQAITRSGVEKRLKIAVTAASEKVPSLMRKKVSPHTFRHTLAMHMLQSGIDLTVISLWLGHEKLETTHRYMEADIKLKEEALGKTSGAKGIMKRFRPDDRLLEFLKSL